MGRVLQSQDIKRGDVAWKFDSNHAQTLTCAAFDALVMAIFFEELHEAGTADEALLELGWMH